MVPPSESPRKYASSSIYLQQSLDKKKFFRFFLRKLPSDTDLPPDFVDSVVTAQLLRRLCVDCVLFMRSRHNKTPAQGQLPERISLSSSSFPAGTVGDLFPGLENLLLLRVIA
jgi:hypothetical protein